MDKITILGTGYYGKALAQILCLNGYKVKFWGVVDQEINDINNHKFNEITLDENMSATNDLQAALSDTNIVIFAVLSKSIAVVTKQLNEVLTNKSVLLINATKGFDPVSGQRLSNIIKQNLKTKKTRLAGLYGPSLANEIMQYSPTQVTAVSENIEDALLVKKIFNNSNFSVETSTDFIGVECISAAKNVVGIAAGILKGLQISDNTFAALIAVAINETMTYVTKQGGKIETLLTQAGIGDLMLSCALPNSRNYKFGYEIGKTANPKKVVEEVQYTVEGFLACEIINQEKNKLNLNLPFFDLIYKILFDYKKPNILLDYFKNLK